jgi:hypothetical protein
VNTQTNPEIEKLKKNLQRLEHASKVRIEALEDRVADLERQVAICATGLTKLAEERIEEVAAKINSFEKGSA